MTWSARASVHVVRVGLLLGALLLAGAAYWVVCGLIVQWFQIRVLDLGSAASLVNTVILSLLMSFRNSVAYQRWLEGRGLWGQLTNDTRNFAAKSAAFVPADV